MRFGVQIAKRGFEYWQGVPFSAPVDSMKRQTQDDHCRSTDEGLHCMYTGTDIQSEGTGSQLEKGCVSIGEGVSCFYPAVVSLPISSFLISLLTYHSKIWAHVYHGIFEEGDVLGVWFWPVGLTICLQNYLVTCVVALISARPIFSWKSYILNKATLPA